jgi:hypothetical protein
MKAYVFRADSEPKMPVIGTQFLFTAFIVFTCGQGCPIQFQFLRDNFLMER